MSFGSMQILNLTLPSPEENLACDEALLDACEEGARPETLRFWEPERHFSTTGAMLGSPCPTAEEGSEAAEEVGEGVTVGKGIGVAGTQDPTSSATRRPNAQ